MIATEEKDAVGPGVLDTLVGYQMRRLSMLFSGDFAQAVGDLGLRQILFGILSIVGDHPGINQGAVGRVLGVQRANMVSLVNELVDRDLVERQVAKEDRRAFALRLTPGGAACMAEAVDRIRRHEDVLLTRLTETERATLLRLLRRIGEAAD